MTKKGLRKKQRLARSKATIVLKKVAKKTGTSIREVRRQAVEMILSGDLRL